MTTEELLNLLTTDTTDTTDTISEDELLNLLTTDTTPEEEPQGKPEKDYVAKLTIEDLEYELRVRGASVRHNVISNAIEVEGFPYESQEHIVANLPTLLYSKLCESYKGCQEQTIANYLRVIATRNCYNPVLDYMKQFAWDGEDHLEEVYQALNIESDDTLSRTLILKWFWQGLSLLHNTATDPFGADGILTLAGDQGIGKTTFFRKMSLSPKFFREGQSIDNYDKDNKRRCVTTWICELGEVDTTLKSDMGMLKAFITNAYDEYRLPYGRVDQQNPRRTNLAATVNGTQFLIDPTGNRRFWTVPLTKIDFDKLDSIDAIQVWLQVWEQYAKGNAQGFRLTRQEQEMLAERNSQCEKEMKGESEVLDILDESQDERMFEMTYMTVSSFKAQHNSLSKYTTKQIGMVLDKLGYTTERKMVDGKRQRARLLPKRKSYTAQ